MQWIEYYQRLRDWREKKFLGHVIIDSIVKLGEETGEVQGAFFKMRWAVDADEHQRWEQNLRGELGDALMTLVSICQQMEWDVDAVALDRMIEKGVIDA